MSNTWSKCTKFFCYYPKDSVRSHELELPSYSSWNCCHRNFNNQLTSFVYGTFTTFYFFKITMCADVSARTVPLTSLQPQ
ncbi:hypothetical protein TcWFU_003147 [Taenia crassiceps]|uniref:Uncharacterized protein n=1 Tax=Taenia crassiceps TaxID=6207 RepID=A0ABR4QGF5_9CEST